MSTRSRIAVALPDGRFISIYCHQDGCPDGVGQFLCEHYGNAMLAKALVDLGDLSRIRQRLAPPEGIAHTFDKPLSCVTVAYGRDRRDKGTDPVHSVNFTALLAAADQCNAEYLYVFQDARWRFVAVPWIKGATMPTEDDLVNVELAA